MTPVPIKLHRSPVAALFEEPGVADEDFEPEVVDDLDALSASGRCSCAASDDNPY